MNKSHVVKIGTYYIQEAHPTLEGEDTLTLTTDKHLAVLMCETTAKVWAEELNGQCITASI